MIPSPRLASAAILACFCAAPSVALAWKPEIVRVERIVRGPSALDEFRRPVGVAIDPARGVFVLADAGNHRLVLFDDTGRARGTLSAPGGGAGLGEPRAIAVDGRGHLFVLDEITQRIHVLNGRGSLLAELHPELPEGADADPRPRDLAVGASGRIYVLYSGENPGVVVLDPQGRTESRIGFGTGRPPLQGPISLAVSPDESLLAVTDPQAKHQIIVFRPDGTVARSFGAHEEARGGFSLAVDVTWGPEGTLWITDTIRHSISVFSDGSYLTRMGGQGWGPGQFNYPAGCGFLAPNRMVVVERAGARFQILELSPPNSVEEELESKSPLGLVFKEETQQ
jgi:DNA-binding beta-propeller fold protein YncE